jgi:integrase
MDSLIDDALAFINRDLAKNTVTQYKTAAAKLKHMLAEFTPQSVTMRAVVDVRRKLAGTPNMANRCISLLRQIFDYGLEQQLIDTNPVVGVKRLAERKRDRLISKTEYDAIYAHAGPRLQVLMDLWYLTGQRVGDVLTIRYADLLDEGIRFSQQKTDAKLIVRWTPELRAVVKRASELHGNVKAMTLLHTRRGKAPDYGTVKWQWDKARTAAGVLDVQLRDLRAMSGTAARRQGKNPTELLGHKSPAMTERYLRDREIPQVDGPSFGHIVDVGQKGTKN